MRIIQWPKGVAEETGVNVETLQERRLGGDAPTLYAVSDRRLVTTDADLLKWIQGKQVPAGYRYREATRKGNAA